MMTAVDVGGIRCVLFMIRVRSRSGVANGISLTCQFRIQLKKKFNRANNYFYKHNIHYLG